MAGLGPRVLARFLRLGGSAVRETKRDTDSIEKRFQFYGLLNHSHLQTTAMPLATLPLSTASRWRTNTHVGAMNPKKYHYFG